MNHRGGDMGNISFWNTMEADAMMECKIHAREFDHHYHFLREGLCLGSVGVSVVGSSGQIRKGMIAVHTRFLVNIYV
jgi:hypothetical protein